MFKIVPTLCISAALFLSGCSDNSPPASKPTSENNLSDADVMTIMHCAEMKMDECKKYEGITLNEAQIKQGCEVMPEMVMCEKKN